MRKFSGTPRGAFNDVKSLVEFSPLRRIDHEQGRMPHDPAHDVVEVVCDSPCESPDRFHLL